MEVSIFSTTIVNKVYKESAILIAAFLGGPLAAGYLMAENFMQLGEPQNVKKTWLWSIVGFIVTTIHALAPYSSSRLLYNLIYLWLVDLLIKRYQSTQIIAHIKAGGALFTTGRSVIVGIVWSIVSFAMTLFCMIILNAFGIVREF